MTAELAERFAPHAGRLFGVAYRMTGSVSDADDCVQDAFLRWCADEREDVENDEAFLVRVVSRLALDRLRRSARQRDDYVGPWLPEPLVGRVGGSTSSGRGDPAETAEMAETLSFAFLVLLDRLTPPERVAFLLHDVFGAPFAEVATVLDRQADDCRQLASRARRKIRDAGEDEGVAADADASAPLGELLGAFMMGDVDRCLGLLAPDVVLVTDAGPNRRAARRHVVGADRVVRVMRNRFERDGPHVTAFGPVVVNGGFGLEVELPAGPMVVTGAVDAAGRVCRLWIQMNPDKLERLTADPR